MFGSGGFSAFARVEGSVHHSLRFDQQSCLDVIRGKNFVIGREVFRCEPVVFASDSADEASDVSLCKLASAFEEHMLYPVRYSSDAGPLVSGAHSVDSPTTGNRGVWDFANEHLQSVIKR